MLLLSEIEEGGSFERGLGGTYDVQRLSSSIQCFQTASNNTFKFSLPSRILRKQTTKEIIR
jgi:hypothetical protein